VVKNKLGETEIRFRLGMGEQPPAGNQMLIPCTTSVSDPESAFRSGSRGGSNISQKIFHHGKL
jgi:hypothetical protein